MGSELDGIVINQSTVTASAGIPERPLQIADCCCAWLQLYKLLVGRQQRVVHTLDVVPALPPLDGYASVDYGRWIPRNETVVLEVPTLEVSCRPHAAAAAAAAARNAAAHGACFVLVYAAPIEMTTCVCRTAQWHPTFQHTIGWVPSSPHLPIMLVLFLMLQPEVLCCCEFSLRCC